MAIKPRSRFGDRATFGFLVRVSLSIFNAVSLEIICKANAHVLNTVQLSQLKRGNLTSFANIYK